MHTEPYLSSTDEGRASPTGDLESFVGDLVFAYLSYLLSLADAGLSSSSPSSPSLKVSLFRFFLDEPVIKVHAW